MQMHYTITPDDYVAFNLFLAKRDPAYRRRVRALQVGGAAAVLALGVIVGFMRGGVTLAGMALFVIVAALFVVYVPSQAKSSLDKQVNLALEQVENNACGDKQIDLLTDGLRLTDKEGETRFPFDRIVHVERTASHLFILTAEKDAITVPLAAFEDVDDAQNFYSTLCKEAGVTAHSA
ncbi:YcxB family protein [Butyricicoccus sp. Marseille-Q5471]|uniref:YcxB family protein n=1 Tax=Butyricicoccus sp. Marseille-Q5471 TaxID=3039493 RepID=UPI0024BCBC50|nr:YcxB family protein [Butyricicoccus sp. Marseille-Q5471]